MPLLRKRDWRGFLGGSSESRLRDKIVVKFEWLLNAVRFELYEGGLVTCADLLVRVKYPAMGSALSKVPCAVVACWWEVKLQERSQELFQAKLLPSPLSNPAEFYSSTVTSMTFIPHRKSPVVSAPPKYNSSIRYLPKSGTE